MHGRSRKTPEELLAILDRARNDYAYGRNLRPDLYKDLIGTAGRLNRDPGNTVFREPATYARPGPAPAYPEFRAGTSYLNVAKLCLLDSLCPGIHEIYRGTLCGRVGNVTINRMVGSELDNLIDLAEKDYVISVDEARRFRARHSRDVTAVRLTVCKWYPGDKGCRNGNDCDFLHAFPTADRQHGEVIFTDFANI